MDKTCLFTDAYIRQIDVLTHISPLWQFYEPNDTETLLSFDR